MLKRYWLTVWQDEEKQTWKIESISKLTETHIVFLTDQGNVKEVKSDTPIQYELKKA